MVAQISISSVRHQLTSPDDQRQAYLLVSVYHSVSACLPSSYYWYLLQPSTDGYDQAELTWVPCYIHTKRCRSTVTHPRTHQSRCHQPYQWRSDVAANRSTRNRWGANGNKKLSYRRETARQLRIHAQLTRCFSAVAV